MQLCLNLARDGFKEVETPPCIIFDVYRNRMACVFLLFIKKQQKSINLDLQDPELFSSVLHRAEQLIKILPKS